MQPAIVVHDVYKKFGKPGEPLWKRVLKPKASQNGNGNSKQGTRENGKSEGDLSDSLQVVIGQQLGGGRQPAVSPPAKDKSTSTVQGNGHKPAAAAAPRETIAVNKVSFEVAEREIFGVLGPNGSGKSTLIRLMATLLLPDAGQLQIFGHDVVKESLAVQRLINRVSVEASFFKKLSPMENLMYGARLYGMGGRETRKEIVRILTRLGLEERVIYNPMEEMSRGMQQKVAIARALLSKPRVLLLDEPTTGLDPRSKLEVQAVVNELRDEWGVTILLTTHDMHEADVLCDRVAIMDKGNVVALDTPTELKKLVSGKHGHETTLEDVFLELTGRQLKTETA